MLETCSQYECPQCGLCESLNWTLPSAAAADNQQVLPHSHQTSLDCIVSSPVPTVVYLTSAVARGIFVCYALLFYTQKIVRKAGWSENGD